MASDRYKSPSSPEPNSGSRANKRLRDAGFVPGVIYGHKEAVVPITLPKKEIVSHLEPRRARVRPGHRRQERKGAGQGSAVRPPRHGSPPRRLRPRVASTKRSKSPCRSSSRASPRAKRTAACSSRSSASWKSSAWSPKSPRSSVTTSSRWSSTTSCTSRT